MKKIETMTIEELTAAAERYDNIHNEGGEGYNPYRAVIDSRLTPTVKTSQRVLTITKGNQYNDDGYYITDGDLFGWGQRAELMNGTIGITRDGNLITTNEEIEKAIADTMADGKERVVEIPEII